MLPTVDTTGLARDEPKSSEYCARKSTPQFGLNEMMAFAAEFDPQPMHLDEAAAKASMLGGLAGSGWHLCSILMRMMFDGFIGRTASMGSPGVNELRWLAPLRPGDDLTLDIEVEEARVSKSRPETGIVTFKGVVRNAAGVALCEMVSPIIVRRRADAAA